MTSYQAALPAAAPRASMRPAVGRQAISRVTSFMVAVLLALLVFGVTVELTMGYGFDEPGQPAARPVPGLGL
jgi:hypothetical protein